MTNIRKNTMLLWMMLIELGLLERRNYRLFGVVLIATPPMYVCMYHQSIIQQ
jgi:hypothetical protein